MAERRRLRTAPPGGAGPAAGRTRRRSCSQRLVANIARYPERLSLLERLELEQPGFGCDACALELRGMGGAFARLERSHRQSEIHDRIYHRVSARIAVERERS